MHDQRSALQPAESPIITTQIQQVNEATDRIVVQGNRLRAIADSLFGGIPEGTSGGKHGSAEAAKPPRAVELKQATSALLHAIDFLADQAGRFEAL